VVLILGRCAWLVVLSVFDCVSLCRKVSFFLTKGQYVFFALSKGVVFIMGRGGGETPPLVVELLKEMVDKKSQSAVSKETGLGLATINSYLKGKGEPTTKTLKILADYLGVSVAVLRGDITQFENLLAAQGMDIPNELSIYDKIVWLTFIDFSMHLNRLVTPCIEHIHAFSNLSKNAQEVLMLPEKFTCKITNSTYLELLKESAHGIINKYQQLLEEAEPEIKEYFVFMNKLQTSGSGFYDLVTAPDYYTKLTATFDSVLSLSLKSKQAQQNKMFLAVAVSLAKLLRDMPKEMADIYDAEYMRDLQKLARKVVKEIDSENLMERWTPPSIKPKLKQAGE
jgi:transcriptional regulator with XRE-family HTH domain